MDFFIHVRVGAIRRPYGEQENTNMKGQDSFSHVGTGEVLYQSGSSSVRHPSREKYFGGISSKYRLCPHYCPYKYLGLLQ